MRILQVCPYDIDRPGGVQQHILDTSAAFAELGHPTTIIAPWTNAVQRSMRKGVDIIRIGRARKINFAGTAFEVSLAVGPRRRELRALMHNTPFDVAHFHTPWTPFLALQVLLGTRCPAVATFHDTPPDSITGRILNILLRLTSRALLPRFAAILVPSPGPQANLATRRTIFVVPPCTNLSRFSRKALDSHRDGIINILFMGRLERRKGVEILLHAFARLEQDKLPVRLLLAGSGTLEGALRTYAAQHRLANVVFIGAPDDAAEWLARADIVCAPSIYGESFGIVIAEAMASGKPVVAAANQGYRQILTGDAADFLTPPGNAGALRERLAVLASDPNLRERLGAWGRREAVRYDCRTWAPVILEIYQSVLAAAPTTQAAV